LHRIDETNDTRVLEQPAILMLQYRVPVEFTPEGRRAYYAYSDPRTDREHASRMGPPISAVMACRAGDPDLDHEHFLRAARADRLDVRHTAGRRQPWAVRWRAVADDGVRLHRPGHHRGWVPQPP
jgi:trehalose/maltose hydrolase-like predicted phosphorylase